MLTEMECSLLVALPLFESGENEGELIEEFCHQIYYNKENIPQDQLKYVLMGLFFGIVGFVDEEKQNELMEMINMTTVYKGVVSEIRKEGERIGERMIISRLLEHSSYHQVARQLGMDEREVRKIMMRKI